MAEVLIEGMTSEWDPARYHDTYRDDLMALINQKIESGQTEVLDETPVEEPEPDAGKVVDIMALLKRSVEATGRRVAADTASNAPDDDEDEEEARPAKKSRAKAKPAVAAASAAAAEPEPAPAPVPAAAGKPKPGARPPKPRAGARKSA
jgi:DNA end-binding protein Ku